MRKDAIECIAKRIVLGAFVEAAVVCGGSKHPQTTPNAPSVGAIALNRPDDAPNGEGAAFVRAALTEACIRDADKGRALPLDASDVARGYRFVGEATEDIVYAPPPNDTLVGNWHRRGTFGEWLRYELGWGFPLGSNATTYSSFSVFNDAKIRPTPRDRSHEICAVGVPMLAIQGVSRFWVADGSGGETTLTSAARTKAAPSHTNRMSHEVAARPQTGAGDAPKARAQPPVCVAQVSQGASDRA